MTSVLNSDKNKEVNIIDVDKDADLISIFTEGMILANYSFTKYYKEEEKKKPMLEILNIYSSVLKQENLSELEKITNAVYFARDLANEPFSGLNALQFSEKLKQLAKNSDLKIEVLDKKEIEENGMGGLLAVNKGSELPPTFNILEWKPENAVNSKPYILVGKGIVFDSGGYSIKPTKNSMDMMKFDMAGAAAVAGAMKAVSENRLPVHIIALIPATDNAVDAKSYVPGDVIKMHNGLFVEVLNTDAEGRLILADALSYAQKYNPELVMDLATLTGAAAYCIGIQASVVMGTAGNTVFDNLKKSGENVYERVVRFPFWDEYKEMLKSKIADIKNIGGSEAGAITAGKFLEYFTDYPWVHIDIAGPAIINKKNAYRTEGGSAYGVRLLYDFFKKMI
ncbi:MAG: peptidase M17 [Bacteroidetes bacterium]|nr:MAG: peptidase M17 [Bacteroidota bacterium]